MTYANKKRIYLWLDNKLIYFISQQLDFHNKLVFNLWLVICCLLLLDIHIIFPSNLNFLQNFYNSQNINY